MEDDVGVAEAQYDLTGIVWRWITSSNPFRSQIIDH